MSPRHTEDGTHFQDNRHKCKCQNHHKSQISVPFHESAQPHSQGHQRQVQNNLFKKLCYCHKAFVPTQEYGIIFSAVNEISL